MGELVTVLITATLAILSVSLLKTYFKLPIKELRRRARKSDRFAEGVYKVAAYGMSAEILLWILISSFSATLFIQLSKDLSWWQAFILVVLVIWAAFWWVPSREVNKLNQQVATLCAPILASLLSILSPLLVRAEKVVSKLTDINIHTGIYEKEDLLEVLDRQSSQIDSRISDQELSIARSALTFGDQLVRDVMTPKRMMSTLYADEALSPHVMDELHGKGFSRLPIYEKSEDGKESVVGILYVKDLVNNLQAGRIADVMDRKVYYVQEQRPLEHVLEAFIKTKHHLFVVVNNFEEVVGVISIEDILEQVIGMKIIDEFDQYDDLRAVAGLEAEKEREEQNHEHQPETPEQTDEKVVE